MHEEMLSTPVFSYSCCVPQISSLGGHCIICLPDKHFFHCLAPTLPIFISGLQVILQSCRGQVDSFVGAYIQLALGKLGDVERVELQDLLVNVVAAALYYNPSLALAALHAQVGLRMPALHLVLAFDLLVYEQSVLSDNWLCPVLRVLSAGRKGV